MTQPAPLALADEVLRRATKMLSQREAEEGAQAAGRRTAVRTALPELMPTSLDVGSELSTRSVPAWVYDLSARGLLVLVGLFVHPGTPMSITLRTVDGELVRLNGVVRRCAFLGGRVHEVGVQLTSAIDPSDFVPGLRSASPKGSGLNEDELQKLIEEIRAVIARNGSDAEVREVIRRLSRV